MMHQQKTITGDFVLLSADNTKILLPQEHVGTATYLEQNTQWQQSTDYPGVFLTDAVIGKYFIALSDTLKPIQTHIDNRFIAVPLEFTNQSFLWCWSSVQILMNTSFTLHEITNTLLAEKTPTTQFIEHDNDIVFVCHANRLVDYALSEDA